LDLFTVTPTQTSIEKSSIVEYLPVSSVQHRALIESDIPATGDQYIDMANIQLYIHAKTATRADGNTALVVDDTAAPINLLLYSMFSEVDILLNGILISNSRNTYPYRATLKMLLTYSEDAKK